MTQRDLSNGLAAAKAGQQHSNDVRSYRLEFLVIHPGATVGALRQQLRKSLPRAHELLVVR
ncbi:MAG TPA: hypothetical protein DCK98_13720 [Chloroflexi bacterium]|nr:hypothetical protein [Chloroflexota bacterium]